MGSYEGILKVAAKRVGISIEEYLALLAAGQKWCTRGQHFAPIVDFGINKLKGDGLQPYCRPCTRVKIRKNTKGRPSAMKGRHHTPEAKQRMAEAHQGPRNHRWKGGISLAKKKDPMKTLAKRAVNHAIEAHVLPSPITLPCSHCAQKAKEYHHYLGYAPEHWLDVIPLCRSCHKE